MIWLSDIQELLESGSREFRMWLDKNQDIENYRDLEYDQSRFATVSNNYSVEAIEKMLEITISKRTMGFLNDQRISPSLFAAIELLENRRRKYKP